MESLSSLGRLIQSLRNERNLSHKELSRQAGVSNQTVRNWEAETYLPRLPELLRVLNALKATEEQKRQAIELLRRPRAVAHIRRASVICTTRPVDTHVPVIPGDLLRALRYRRGRTLEETAAKLGVATRTLSRWERGELTLVSTQLHSVCQVLEASEEESVLLRLGMTASGTTEQSALTNVEELRAQLNATNTYPPEKTDLLELTYLSLALRLQPQAWQDPVARELLSQVYALLAHHYYLASRYKKTVVFAERALQLIEDAPVASEPAMIALIDYNKVRRNPQEGVELLNRWLPRVVDPALEARLRAQRNKLLTQLTRSMKANPVSSPLSPSAVKGKQLDRARLFSLPPSIPSLLPHPADLRSRSLPF